VREKSAARGRAPRKLPRRSLAAQHVCVCVRIFLHSSFSNASFSIFLTNILIALFSFFFLIFFFFSGARAAHREKRPKSDAHSHACVCVCIYILSRSLALSDVFFRGWSNSRSNVSSVFPQEREYEENQESLCCVLRDFLACLPQHATHNARDAQRHNSAQRIKKITRDHTRREKKHT
jgi:hypothetical protein